MDTRIYLWGSQTLGLRARGRRALQGARGFPLYLPLSFSLLGYVRIAGVYAAFLAFLRVRAVQMSEVNLLCSSGLETFLFSPALCVAEISDLFTLLAIPFSTHRAHVCIYLDSLSCVLYYSFPLSVLSPKHVAAEHSLEIYP